MPKRVTKWRLAPVWGALCASATGVAATTFPPSARAISPLVASTPSASAISPLVALSALHSQQSRDAFCSGQPSVAADKLSKETVRSKKQKDLNSERVAQAQQKDRGCVLPIGEQTTATATTTGLAIPPAIAVLPVVAGASSSFLPLIGGLGAIVSGAGAGIAASSNNGLGLRLRPVSPD